MIATVKPVIKQYQDHNGEYRQTEAFDFDEERKAYEIESKKSKKKN